MKPCIFASPRHEEEEDGHPSRSPSKRSKLSQLDSQPQKYRWDDLREDRPRQQRQKEYNEPRHEPPRREVPARSYDNSHLEPEPELAILPAKRSPFTTAILAQALPKHNKFDNLQEYKGTGDPQDHIDNFYAKADLYDISDAIFCKIFCTTLSDKALSWFNSLPGRAIDSLGTFFARFKASSPLTANILRQLNTSSDSPRGRRAT